ncbi:MAG: hypothetical protein U1E65_18200 [Myxococcota bacterium]
MKRSGALGFLLVLGCTQEHRLVLTPPDGARAALVRDLSKPERPLNALDLEVPGAMISDAGFGDRVEVLYLGRPLAELQLTPGSVPLGGTRPLPACALLGAVTVDLGVQPATPTALGPPTSIPTLPDFDALACLDGGRCVTAICGGQTDLGCSESCHIEAPRPPAPPQPPNCPSGWTQTSADPVDCEPPERLDFCDPDELNCNPTCGSGFTDAQRALAGAVFVQAGALGPGHGTLAEPYPTLERALAQTSTGAVLALAAGSYPAPVSLPGARVLVGACPERTVLEGALTLSRGGLRTTDLSFRGGLALQAGATATIARANLWGTVQASGAHLRLGSVRVRPALADPVAIAADGGATLVLEDADVVQAPRAATRTLEAGSSSVTVRRSLLRGPLRLDGSTVTITDSGLFALADPVAERLIFANDQTLLRQVVTRAAALVFTGGGAFELSDLIAAEAREDVSLANLACGGAGASRPPTAIFVCFAHGSLSRAVLHDGTQCTDRGGLSIADAWIASTRTGIGNEAGCTGSLRRLVVRSEEQGIELPDVDQLDARFEDLFIQADLEHRQRVGLSVRDLFEVKKPDQLNPSPGVERVAINASFGGIKFDGRAGGANALHFDDLQVESDGPGMSVGFERLGMRFTRFRVQSDQAPALKLNGGAPTLDFQDGLFIAEKHCWIEGPGTLEATSFLQVRLSTATLPHCR